MTEVPGDGQGKKSAPEPAPAEGRGWNRDYGQWRRGRLRAVQASAQVWLSLITTLLGLLGTVVLVKGGSLVTGVTSSGLGQTVLIVLIALVFGSGVLALVTGGVATWGGLGDIPPDAPGDGREGVLPGTSGDSHRQPSAVRLSAGKLLFRAALTLALISPEDRALALKAIERPQDQGPKLTDWQKYRADIVDNANRNRIYLHASRTLGVFTAVFIAAFAIAATVAGTVAPVPANVIVVHHGQLTCGPFSDSAKETGVTQVVAVTSC